MRKFSRILGVLLASSLLAGLPGGLGENMDAAEVYAAEENAIGKSGERTLKEIPERPLYRERSLEEASVDRLQKETEIFLELEQVIRDALWNGETNIDLQDREIDAEYELTDFRYFSPYCANGVDFTFWYQGEHYTNIEIENPLSLEETRNFIEQIEAKVAEIMSVTSDEMTDVQKLLAVHDYFVADFTYGTNPHSYEETYQSGGMFRDRVGVCQAYAFGYKYIMNKLGIECHVTSSSEINHAWNIVKVDGEYYHVDCTWDDPMEDNWGVVYHDDFLLSDEAAINGGHEGWDLSSTISCIDKKYENEYWTQATSSVVQKDGYAYYVKDHGIYKRNLATGQEQQLADIGVWYFWGEEVYIDQAYSGLSFYNGNLIYNTREEIRRMALNGGDNALVYRPDTSNGYIYGSHISGNSLEYIIKQSPWMAAAVQDAPVSLDDIPAGDPDAPPYSDVSRDAWYYNSVKYVYEKGLMTGLNAFTFGSGDPLARAQFAIILHRMNGTPAVDYTARFRDVGEGIWYTDAILWAADTGVVTGYSNGNFGPGDNINREQMAVMMYRYAAYKGYDTSVKADFGQYQDAGRVSDFAQEAMQWAVGEQIITGKYNETQLDPQGNASRAECATIMMRFMERYEK